MKRIVVAKKYPNHNREVRFYVGGDFYPEATVLSELDSDSVLKVIDHLTALVGSNNPDSYYEWGVDQFSVVSRAVTSSCRNDSEGTALPEVPTAFLLELMVEIRDFKQEYEDTVVLQDILHRAFAGIKADPLQYRTDTGYYDIQIEGVAISLQLSDSDFELMEGAFLNQLATQ